MSKTGFLLFKIIVVYVLFPVALFFIPSSFFTNSHSICLYRNIFGIECPGCGITRAVLSLIHLKFSEALTYNKLVVIVFPVLVYIFLKQALFDIIKFLHFRNNQQV